jgi:hypothetical protein
MSQLNIHMTPQFEKDLQKFMKARHISTKAQAIRVAIQEGLERVVLAQRKVDFSAWLGMGNRAPVNRKTRFRSDDDLWT